MTYDPHDPETLARLVDRLSEALDVAKAKLAARDRQLAYTKELLTEARATLRERDGEIRALHYPGTTPGRRASGAVAPCEACGGAGFVRARNETR